MDVSATLVVDFRRDRGLSSAPFPVFSTRAANLTKITAVDIVVDAKDKGGAHVQGAANDHVV